jgi:hypothetical protein
MQKTISHVGIFFVIEGVVVRDSVSIEKGQPYGDHVEHGGHYDYWLNLAPVNVPESTFKAHAYDYFPRGRVVFDSQHQQMKLYIDRCIKGATFTAIREEFAMPQDTLISYDAHYQCHSCNRTYIDDFDENEE